MKKILGHQFYTKPQPTYQALGSDGIARECKCDRCGSVGVANFAYGVDFDKVDKKVVSKYINKRGIILERKG